MKKQNKEECLLEKNLDKENPDNNMAAILTENENNDSKASFSLITDVYDPNQSNSQINAS